MKFNINNKVRVKLTKVGHAVHRTNHMKLHEHYLPASKPEYASPTEDLEGWSTWTLWDLMHEFGPYLYMGTNIPFETEIDLPENQDI